MLCVILFTIKLALEVEKSSEGDSKHKIFSGVNLVIGGQITTKSCYFLLFCPSVYYDLCFLHV
ncbi:hypothetical protein GYH30_049701 [Glycine max]|uniref:Uncharacterized protein n=1 Tax=Glycine max TaxID=3847 RepID=K7MRF3_SOYBN|nr:hypothetical protein GYH30_049701 [Glycine max]